VQRFAGSRATRQLFIHADAANAVFRARQLSRLLCDKRPDIVHAFRLPFEGIAAALADFKIPLVLSTWGNDLTLFAARSRAVGALTRRALSRASALHSDCMRDLRLAKEWGFDSDKPSIVLPGSGGVRAELFNQQPEESPLVERYRLDRAAPIIINPRGLRPYSVRHDVVFQAIPRVLHEWPDAILVGVDMADSVQARQWVAKLDIQDHVRLLPKLSQHDLASLFRVSLISLSISEHDGTPNTLLEAMACGTLPVAGDIESIREWISHGENGLLCNPGNVDSVAGAVIMALGDEGLRRRARDINAALIRERASYEACMPRAEQFYHGIVAQQYVASQS
jgi:glycosyltransferase involved in cell wall biosynthesis